MRMWIRNTALNEIYSLLKISAIIVLGNAKTRNFKGQRHRGSLLSWYLENKI
jgi:hypothetical protein